jgi:hypothetical protein
MLRDIDLGNFKSSQTLKCGRECASQQNAGNNAKSYPDGLIALKKTDGRRGAASYCRSVSGGHLGLQSGVAAAVVNQAAANYRV